MTERCDVTILFLQGPDHVRTFEATAAEACCIDTAIHQPPPQLCRELETPVERPVRRLLKHIAFYDRCDAQPIATIDH